MLDLIPPDDRKPATIDFTRACPNHADNWSIDVSKQTVAHKGTSDAGFGLVTFPNIMINGEFSARVCVDTNQFQNPDTDKRPNCCGQLVFRYLDPDRYYSFGIGGWGFNWSAFYKKPMMDAYRPWQVGGVQGDEKCRGEQYYDLSVRVFGSSLECFRNGSREWSATLPPDADYRLGNIGLYSYKDSPISFSDIQLHLAPLTCFIVSPINKVFDKTVYYFAKKTIEALEIEGHKVKCVRADDNTRSEPFIRTVIKQMEQANITVVLVPGEENKPENRNENVFYELGMAHAKGLPTIIYAENHKRMPADLQHLNIISNPAQLVRSVKQILRSDVYGQVYVA